MLAICLITRTADRTLMAAVVLVVPKHAHPQYRGDYPKGTIGPSRRTLTGPGIGARDLPHEDRNSAVEGMGGPAGTVLGVWTPGHRDQTTGAT
jgi:hypothetical protein